MPDENPTFQPFRRLSAVPLLAAVLLCSGCLSIPVGPTDGQVQSVEKTGRTTGVVGGINHTVRHEGRNLVVTFFAEGDFQVERQTVETKTATHEKVVTLGLFPGLGSCTDTGNVLGNGIAAFWYNLCMLGTPTLDGLLFAPFREPGEPVSGIGGDGFFSRSALLGYHAHVRPMASAKTESRVASTRTDSLDRIPLTPWAKPVDWGDWERTPFGELRLRNVPSDRNEFKFRIDIPGTEDFKGLYDDLSGYTKDTYPIHVR